MANYFSSGYEGFSEACEDMMSEEEKQMVLGLLDCVHDMSEDACQFIQDLAEKGEFMPLSEGQRSWLERLAETHL